MSAFGIFLYTTVGGVIGAGLTQYVTHLRDRRTARAAIIEKIAAAEAEYAAFTEKPEESLTTQDSLISVELNKCLASLEAACLIAGVPRANVTTYIVSRRAGARVSVFRGVVKFANSEADRRKTAIEAGLIDESTARLDEGLALAKTIQSTLNELKDPCEELAYIAFNELMRSVWHPFISQARKGELHKLQKRMRDLEAAITNSERMFNEVRASARKLENKRRKEMLPPPESPKVHP